ncbi:MAG: hypothetical protein IT370_09520, partial [Deltaproteobacteria bacterium]|nr:hypothetical protein [Deltaproteobacteria bacterium]
PLALLALLAAAAGGGCGGPRTSTGRPGGRAAQAGPDAGAQAAPLHDAGAPGPALVGDFPAFEATLRELQLGRDLGDAPGATELLSSTCSGYLLPVTTPTGVVQVRLGGCFHCQLQPESEAVRAAVDTARVAGFAQALRETPARFMATAKVDRVALCWRLWMEPLGDGGVAADALPIGGTVDPGRHEIMLSLEAMEGLTGQDIVHHELYHVLDVVSDPRRAMLDPAWSLLNPRGFEYLHRDGDAPIPGFLNVHAMANLREDHATVYQFAMARPAELCAADPLIRAKARLIRDRVAVSLGDADYLVRRAPCLAPAAPR